jgi:hypothetical protein
VKEAKMRIVLSPHAKDRLLERGIKEDQVKEALFNPDVRAPTKHRRRKRAMKTFGNKTVDVIYEERLDKIIVVTCAVLEKGGDHVDNV